MYNLIKIISGNLFLFLDDFGILNINSKNISSVLEDALQNYLKIVKNTDINNFWVWTKKRDLSDPI